MSSSRLVIRSEVSVSGTGVSRTIGSVSFNDNGNSIIDTPSVLYMPRVMGWGKLPDSNYWTLTNDGYESGAPMTLTEVQLVPVVNDLVNYLITPSEYANLSSDSAANYRPVYRTNTVSDYGTGSYSAASGEYENWPYLYSTGQPSNSTVGYENGIYKLINFDKYTNSNDFLKLLVKYTFVGKIDSTINDDGICIGTAVSKINSTTRKWYYHPRISRQPIGLVFGGIKAKTVDVSGEEKVEVLVRAYSGTMGANNTIGAKTGVDPFTDNDAVSYHFYCPPTIFGAATSSDFVDVGNTGDAYYIGKTVAFSYTEDTEIPIEPEPEPDPVPVTPNESTDYEIWVTARVNGRVNLVYNNAFSGTYFQDDYYVRLVDSATTNIISGNITWHYGNTTEVASTLLFSSVCSYSPFYAEYNNQTISLTRFRIAPQVIEPSTSSAFIKYYDGNTDVAIPSLNLFSYDGIYTGDDVVPIPLGTYASSNAGSSNNPVTFTFELTGADAPNYSIGALEAEGQIIVLSSAQQQTKEGYSIKLRGPNDAVMSPFPTEVPYDASGYDLVVYKNSTPLDDNASSSYDISWTYGFSTIQGTGARHAFTAVFTVTNAGTYEGKVYVTNSDFPAGYAYIGTWELDVLPVINVSWIAASY